MSFKVPEKFRITTGPLGSNESFGNNGAFWVKTKKCVFTVIASDQMGWEHVSVSLPVRCPTWEEMCFIKSLFWDEEIDDLKAKLSEVQRVIDIYEDGDIDSLSDFARYVKQALRGAND